MKLQPLASRNEGVAAVRLRAGRMWEESGGEAAAERRCILSAGGQRNAHCGDVVKQLGTHKSSEGASHGMEPSPLPRHFLKEEEGGCLLVHVTSSGHGLGVDEMLAAPALPFLVRHL